MTNWINANSNTPATPTSNIMHSGTNREPQYEVGKGGIEVTGSGPTRGSAPASYTAGQEAPADGSIMGTVKAAHGGVVIGRNPVGSDIVSIGGMTTTIDAAVAAGLLVRNHDGSFADKEAPASLKDPVTEAQAKAPAEKAEVGEAEGDDFGLPEDAQKALGKLVSEVMPGDAIKAMDSILVNGDLDPRTVERVATQMGVEPHEAADVINTAHQGFYDVATGIIEDAGIDTEAFEAFVASDPQRGTKMIETARAMVMQNDTAGLQELTSSFYEHADRFMPEETRAALTDAGFGFREEADGLKVLINGAPVSFAVAVKQGIIKFI